MVPTLRVEHRLPSSTRTYSAGPGAQAVEPRRRATRPAGVDIARARAAPSPLQLVDHLHDRLRDRRPVPDRERARPRGHRRRRGLIRGSRRRRRPERTGGSSARPEAHAPWCSTRPQTGCRPRPRPRGRRWRPRTSRAAARRAPARATRGAAGPGGSRRCPSDMQNVCAPFARWYATPRVPSRYTTSVGMWKCISCAMSANASACPSVDARLEQREPEVRAQEEQDAHAREALEQVLEVARRTGSARCSAARVREPPDAPDRVQRERQEHDHAASAPARPGAGTR